jgi:hypothetical protein
MYIDCEKKINFNFLNRLILTKEKKYIKKAI